MTARDGSLTARDSVRVVAMDREHNSNGRRWTARCRMDGDGWRGATAMDGTTATRRQGTGRWCLDDDGRRGTALA